MTVTKARKAVRGRRVRGTRLDACGRVVYGEASQAVSKGFITVGWTANTVSTTEIVQELADGERGVYEPSENSVSGYTLNIEFNEVDPEFFSLLTGHRVYLDAFGRAIGFAINGKISLENVAFALEVWAGTPSAACEPGADVEYGYFLAPFLKGGYVADYTVQNGAINFTITGATTREGNAWGVGPYNVMRGADGTPGPLLTPLEPEDFKLLIWVDVAPPELFYGTRPVLDPDSAAITAITVAEGSSPTEANFTFTGAAAGVPVWIDFGDGTWDYLPDGTTGASHVYEENGSYAARATSDNQVWRTVPVTIPFP